MAKRWEFKALDTLFFREAMPFNQGEGGQGEQGSLFPPAMTTLQGAIRYQLAWHQGWRPGKDGSWPDRLGDNDDLGDLMLRGPYLCWSGRPLFPAPLYLLRRGEETVEFNRLIPGNRVKTDLGEVCLPKMPDNWSGSKVAEGCWLTGAGMTRVLAGGVPDDLHPEDDRREVWFPKDLWAEETKVGIGRDNQTRTASDSQLYAIKMIRPEKKLTLAVEVDGIPEQWSANMPTVVNLGGEGKQVALKVSNGQIPLPPVAEIEPVHGKIRYTATLITPAYLGAKIEEAFKGKIDGCPGQCVTACLGKMILIGGWDLKLGGPRPLRPFLPVGSTWFFEAESKDIDTIKALHGSCLGAEKEDHYGYGQILIGEWGRER